MTRQAYNALRKSITHWKRLSGLQKRLEDESTGSAHCALCQEFHIGISCQGCPVKAKTGKSHCHDTPYAAACQAKHGYGLDSEKFMSAAKKELAFLCSLLPKKKAKRRVT